jgi:tetratricopeptide (TPR) repeat protein
VIVLALVLAQAGPPVGWSNGRPPECTSLEGPKAGNVWERAKAPQLRAYCDLLASGASKVAGAGAGAADALRIADEAERTLPGRAGPPVLRGRALARLGRWSEAYAALADAKAKDDRALDEPTALLAWARALARGQRAKEAADAYRALLPRASSLTPTDRASACLEAGLLAMARGASGLDDAVPILRQGVRESQDALHVAGLAALALALGRAGQHDEAKATLGQRPLGDVRAVLGDVRVRDALATAAGPAEAHALLAVAIEAADPAGAREAWRAHADAKGPFADHARAREAALAGRGRRPR